MGKLTPLRLLRQTLSSDQIDAGKRPIALGSRVCARIRCDDGPSGAPLPVMRQRRSNGDSMVRFIALCAGLAFYALEWAGAEQPAALSPCKRPVDQYGPRYEAVSGAYRSRGVSPGGGKFVTIMPRDGAAPVSVTVTDEVFNVVGSLRIGIQITLVSYVSRSLFGAEPPYSCIELAR